MNVKGKCQSAHQVIKDRVHVHSALLILPLRHPKPIQAFPQPRDEKAATRLLDELCHLTAQSLTPLETSDHFQVIKLLGEGSYGKVMLAVHKKRGTPMALKFFPRDSTSFLSFLREYNLSLAFCSHPSLTSALGIAFSTPSHYVFAQQPSLYGDLFDYIVPEVGLEESCVQRVTSQLSGALSHLHSLGFVHRDVKPENVFLCDRACRWVKLGDFGMVKATGTRVPAVWYSSAYCTPEAEIARESEEKEIICPPVDENGNQGPGEKVQEKKRKRVLVPVEPSTDSWSLGILIYAMLTGTLPWHETASHNTAYRRYREWSEQEEVEERGVRGPVTRQFSAFTPLACSLFRTLLHPRPGLRGLPDEVLGYLGGAWLLANERSG
ncbi:serine/threonine-protein kinase SBK1 [Chanos chanos]|uniref:Serine/threonine-protein kinase SBK1 n=1 Tax=Chanos chanos TaxID=29144 RepID=A0A6J2WLD8_CHACN|nr:serine/threonine-protein kinase SBK1-like [Chanos chanos]